jgi:hypothetical protein
MCHRCAQTVQAGLLAEYIVEMRTLRALESFLHDSVPADYESCAFVYVLAGPDSLRLVSEAAG